MKVTEYISVILALLGVVGLIFLTYILMKWLNKRTNSISSKSVNVIERINIGQDKCILVVKAGTKYMLLGVTGQHIEKISDLSEDDINIINTEMTKENEYGSFMDNLKKATLNHQFLKPFVKDKGRNDND